jgi:hypothetical protein
MSPSVMDGVAKFNANIAIPSDVLERLGNNEDSQA